MDSGLPPLVRKLREWAEIRVRQSEVTDDMLAHRSSGSRLATSWARQAVEFFDGLRGRSVRDMSLWHRVVHDALPRCLRDGLGYHLRRAV